MASTDTICAIATAKGAAAIGVLRLSGPEARSILSRCVVSVPAPRQAALRTLTDPRGGKVVDRAMVLWMPGPRSYTGEDVVEIFGHGGVFNMEAMQQLLVDQGARLATAGEFTRRAFLNNKMDLVQAEAVARVIEARSLRGLQNAQALLGGELGRHIRTLREGALALAADLEACIDFADESDAAVPQTALVAQARNLEQALHTLLQSYDERGALEGVDIALVGRVNVGKSSLLNALLGSERALVSEQGGTTRDYLEVQQNWGGLAVTLVDTAGQRDRQSMSTLERAGHELGERRVARCDISLLLLDLSGTVRQREEAVAAAAPDALLVGNKIDLLAPSQLLELEKWARGLGRPVALVSAKTQAGLDQLKELVVQQALPEGDGETIRITERRQFEALRLAGSGASHGRRAVERAMVPEVAVEHLRQVLGHLDELLGEQYGEQVLDRIFSRFCIGK